MFPSVVPLYCLYFLGPHFALQLLPCPYPCLSQRVTFSDWLFCFSTRFYLPVVQLKSRSQLSLFVSFGALARWRAAGESLGFTSHPTPVETERDDPCLLGGLDTMREMTGVPATPLAGAHPGTPTRSWVVHPPGADHTGPTAASVTTSAALSLPMLRSDRKAKRKRSEAAA